MRVVIGLGSNVGDRRATLRSAARAISEHVRVLSRSFLYETAPVGGVPQPDFLNAAIAVEVDRPLFALLSLLHEIEAAHGRVREKELRWGPRTLDLDVLWAAGETSDDPRLVVPHPRLHERAFALLPLRDVAPDAMVGVDVDSAGVTRLDERL